MDEAQLRRLSSELLPGAVELRELASWCLDRAESTGDARYCGLARTFDGIADEWEYDARRFTHSWLLNIQQVFNLHMSAVLDAPTAEEGAGLARLLREEVERQFA